MRAGENMASRLTASEQGGAPPRTTPTSGRGAESIRARLWWIVGLAGALLVPAVLTVLRYTHDWLQADGVWQSVMSVQGPELFYWGQDRFFAFWPLVLSPISDPGLNLFVCLLVNSLAFYGLLMLVAHMAAPVVSGVGPARAAGRAGRARLRLATLTVFLALVATAQLVLSPFAHYSLALEASPHPTAWLMALGSYQLWKRRRWWTAAAAVLLILVSAGLSAQAVLISGALTVVVVLRERSVRRWVGYLAVWAAALILWWVLSRTAPGDPGPNPAPSPNYFEFGVTQLRSGAEQSLTSVLSAFRISWVVPAVALAAAALLTVRDRWAALAPRLGFAMAFGAGFWLLFTANTWAALNAYEFRYFFPVVVLPVVAIAIPIGSALVRLISPDSVTESRPGSSVRSPAPAARRSRLRVGLVVGAGIAMILVAVSEPLSGPLEAPGDARTLEGTRQVADFVTENGITFLSGYYWDMWPTLHQTLEGGREAHLVAAGKSRGERWEYQRAFATDLAEQGQSRAVCVNEDVSVCQTYLSYWTAPGWQDAGQDCPVPAREQVLGSPPVSACRILVNTG